ncbi:MAG TPA: nitrate/sulfonate/bicarbonate ABC transporter ATP-binding protein [Acidobacteriota bacterium]|nr:nitrate/sulfonate/bicarbonate ABC transporter ATP-binding protein [Acidobacteriota bacterium]
MNSSSMPVYDEELVTLEHIDKVYGEKDRKFVAISDVSLKIRTGEFVCLLGPSGCGKSTLLRIITGLNVASSGNVLYRGKPTEGINPHATIVFQTFALYPWLTVLDNVEIALKAHGVEASARRDRALKLIDMVGLDGFESAYPRELSGGMRQKVGFARAMGVEPELLCLDEPFSALDVLSAEALRGELMELWTAHSIPTKAILMVTHNIEEAVLMADRIIVMGKDPGRVVTEMSVGLRQPRQRKDTAFQAFTDKVYAAVAGKTEPATLGTVPGQPGRRQKLPAAHLNALAGLVEKIAADHGRSDLYVLSSDLAMNLDELLPIVDAGEIIGFLVVHEGDLVLTPLGQAYADASILARKELVSGRILRLPIISWIYETLQQDDNQRVAKEYFVDKLQVDFADRSEKQLMIAIQWGRFAEVFGYDDDTDELFLESQGG